MIQKAYDIKNLSYVLINDFFLVVREQEESFKKFKSLKDFLKQLKITEKNLNQEESYTHLKFCTLALELYNCCDRLVDTYKITDAPKISYLSEIIYENAVDKKELDAFLKEFCLEIVFTAHPTEVFPINVLKIINQIEAMLEKVVSAKHFDKQHRYKQALKSQLATLWLTQEFNKNKPSPEDEARRLFYFFENSIWQSTPYFYRKFYLEYKKHYNESPSSYPNIKFSSWIGGDRDGNPFVTAESTTRIILESRRRVLKLIMKELYILSEEVLIKTKVSALKKKYPDSDSPYSLFFKDLLKKVQNFSFDAEKLFHVEKLQQELKSELKNAYDYLIADEAKRIADRRLRSLMDRVWTFSLSPLKLDLRQDSEVHAAILKELTDFCGGKLNKKTLLKSSFDSLSPLSQDFFQSLSLVKSMSPCPFNVYIISMTRSAKDIQNLKTLMEIAGVELPIVPLFETPEDIRRADAILEECEQKSIPLKQIMWGYSDSTKKGGRLASAWNLYSEQKKIQKKYPELVHFHGRGGSIARGGGPHPLVFSLLPTKTVGKHFRQTFQGEVIQDEFGLKMRARETLETLFCESIKNNFRKERSTPKKVLDQITKLAQTSEEEFQKAFYEEKALSESFDQDSPISIINTLNLGSRPSKRKFKVGPSNYRAIPWVFAWAQTRGSLPLWYGLHKVLKDLISLQKNSYFVDSFLKLTKTGLQKTEPNIFKTYSPHFKSLAKELEESLRLLEIHTQNSEANIKEQLVPALHQAQQSSLKSRSKSKIIDKIKKISSQGIATYLGKSG